MKYYVPVDSKLATRGLTPGYTQYILFESFDETVQYAVVHNLKRRA